MRWVMPIGLGILLLGGWMIRTAPDAVFALAGLCCAGAGICLLYFGATALTQEKHPWANANRIRDEHDLEVERLCREAGDLVQRGRE